MGGSVLIIDGDQQFAESAQSALEAAGITAHVRPDASLDVVRSLRPHVLLLNVELPRGSGFSICSRIRRDKLLRETPILLTTSDTPVEALKRHAQTADRANDYAKKPFDLEDMVTRVGRLIALAPERPDLETTAEELPPAVLEAAAGGPPPMPPKLRRTDEPSLGSTAATAAAGPLQAEDLWPRAEFDEAIRGSIASPAAEMRLKGRATPEERIDQLRQQVKLLEAQKRAVQETWGHIDLRGQELGRRVVSLTLEVDKQNEQLAALAQAKEQTEQQLGTVQGEFRAFQEEITRIFKEKDTEERERLAHYEQLEQSNAALSAQLQEGQERQVDDERRLQIMQEELDFLQNEKDQIELTLKETAEALEKKTDSESDLQARLTATETVASERADEISTLRDKLDDLGLESAEAQRSLEEAHAAQILSLQTEQAAALDKERSEREAERALLVDTHEGALTQAATDHDFAIQALQGELSQTIERLEAQREQELEAVNQRHADLLDALSSTHEAEIRELGAARDEAQRELELTAESLETTRTELEALRTSSAATDAQLEQAVAEGEQLRADLDATRASEAELGRERDELEQEIDETADALRAARSRVAELEAGLATAEQEATAQITDLQARLEAQTAEAAARVEDLSSQLAEQQGELFARSSTLDALQASHDKLTEAHQQVGAQLETTAVALEASEATLEEAEARSALAVAEQAKLIEQVERLEAQHTRLEATVRETNEMLEDERAHRRELDDQVTKAGAREAELRESIREFEDELETERTARQEMEAALEANQRARQELETEAQAARAAQAVAEARAEAEHRAKTGLEAALAEVRNALADREAQVAEISSARGDAERKAELIRREKGGAVSKLEQEILHLQGEQARLQSALEGKDKEAQDTRGALDEAQAKAASLESERQTSTAQARALDRDLRAAQRRVESLQAQLDARTAAEGDAKAEIDALSDARDAAVAAAEAERAAERQAADDLREALDQITAERDKLARAQARLQTERDQQAEAIAAARAEAETLRRAAHDKDLALTRRGTQDADLAALVTTKTEEAALWQGHVEQMRGSLEAAQARAAQAEAQRDELLAKSRTTERDAPLRRRLSAAEKEIRGLRGQRKTLESQVEASEERINEIRFAQETIRSTLQTIESDLAKEQKAQSGNTAQYSLLLGKVSRALAMSIEVLEGDDDDELPIASGAEIQEYTGEVEPLEQSSATTHAGPFPGHAGMRSGGSAENMRALNPSPQRSREPTLEITPDEPFADLVRELRAVAEAPIEEEGPPTITGPRRGFDEAFAAEATSTDHHSLSGLVGVRLPSVSGGEEEEEDERNVTEIIDLQKLEHPE